MSYILEALKKSDQERSRGTAPGLQTVQAPLTPEPARKRHGWVYLLAFALLVNVGLLLWFLRPWQSAAPQADRPAAQQQTAPVQSQAVKTAAAEPAVAAGPTAGREVASRPGTADRREEGKPGVPGQPTAGMEKPPAAAREKTPAPIPEESAKPAGAAQAGAGQADKQKEAGGAQAQKPPKAAQTALSPAPPSAAVKRNANSGDRGKDEQTASAKPVKEGPPAKPEQTDAVQGARPAEPPAKAVEEALKSIAAPAPPAASSSEPAGGKEEVPGVRSLPVGLQKEIPELSLSFLVYADKPADRMVNINGQMMREGQEVAAGLKLEQITPDGAVFSYKGARFKKGVL